VNAGFQLDLRRMRLSRRNHSLIETRDLDDVDPRAWLADVLERLPDHRVGEMMPCAWKASQEITRVTNAVAA
jgi:hypothetical protein